jgi:hypothetical protein
MLRTNGVTGYFSYTSSTHHVRPCPPPYDPGTLTMRRRTVTLPLWSPSVVKIGSVGYLRKPVGEFVTLFNASNPPQSSGGVPRDMANLSDYGKVTQGSQRQDKRDRRNSTSRRYLFGLKAKNKIAFLCTESATYTYIENLSAPKLWFKDNADEILRSYAYSHPITKEDLFLGTRNVFDLDRSAYHPHGSHRDAQCAGPCFVCQSHSPQLSGTRESIGVITKMLKLLKSGAVRGFCFPSERPTLGTIQPID